MIQEIVNLGPSSLKGRNEITAELRDRFISYLDVTEKTQQTYTRALQQFMKWLAKHNITHPEREDILQYREDLRTTCKPATVQAYLIAVKLFFKWTESAGLYENIADRIKGSKISKAHKRDPLTSNQIRDILEGIDRNSVQGRRDWAIIALAATSGTRTIELQRANIEDLRTLGAEVVLYLQGKGRDEKSEYVKLTAPVERGIRAYLRDRPGAKPSDPLFASVSDRNSGGRLSTKSYSRLIKSAFTQAGYDSDRLTAHSLRHTAATLNLINGGSLEETQMLLRHTNVSSTLIYLHHIERANNHSEQRISDSIFEVQVN